MQMCNENQTAYITKDAFPEDETVWGKFDTRFALLLKTPDLRLLSRQGIAYTIDPNYEVEAREYLG